MTIKVNTKELENQISDELNSSRDAVCSVLLDLLRRNPNHNDENDPLTTSSTKELQIGQGQFLEIAMTAEGTHSDKPVEELMEVAIVQHQEQCQAKVHNAEIGSDALSINSEPKIVDSGEGTIFLRFRTALKAVESH